MKGYSYAACKCSSFGGKLEMDGGWLALAGDSKTLVLPIAG